MVFYVHLFRLPVVAPAKAVTAAFYSFYFRFWCFCYKTRSLLICASLYPASMLKVATSFKFIKFNFVEAAGNPLLHYVILSKVEEAPERRGVF
jgi:hypothetical protein